MYKNILLTVDLTDASSWQEALPTAVGYCQAFGSTLYLLTVVPDFGMTVVAQYFPADFEAKALEESRRKLTALRDENVPEGLTAACVVAYGSVYDEIMKTAAEIDADLIVMASHRPELKDYLLGPNAARVVRHSERSVLVVRD